MKTLIAIPSLLLAAHTCLAAEATVLSGLELAGRNASYLYAGVLSPLTESADGRRWVVRHWFDRVTYRYDSGGQKIDAEAIAYAPALGYQTRMGDGQFGLYAGLRFAHTRLRPDDPGNVSRGFQNRLFFQTDILSAVAPGIENQLVAQAETGTRGYYLRDRLLLRTRGDGTLGPEIVLKGGRDYQGWQAGLAYGGPSFGQGLHLVLRAGLAGQRGESSGGYGGAELSMTFR